MQQQKPSSCVYCELYVPMKKIKKSQNQLVICQNCQILQKETLQSLESSVSSNSNKCLSCTYQNTANALQCSVCEELLVQNLLPKSLEPVDSLILCPKCKFQNHISNICCINCQEQLFERQKEQCQVCGFKIFIDLFEEHYRNCLLSQSLIQSQKLKIKSIRQLEQTELRKTQLIKLKTYLERIKKVMQPKSPKKNSIFSFFKSQKNAEPECTQCHEKFSQVSIKDHEKSCPKKNQYLEKVNDPTSRLTSLQRKALAYMFQKTQKEHLSQKTLLLARIKKLGYTAQDLDNLQFYIQNYAPIIIQIHISRHMQFFLKDTHYRSQFQTNKSSGSLSRPSRIAWENKTFDNQYANAKDFERVKYGVINFTNDPKGVQCAKNYGPSYFLLKSHVRQRCTFTNKDSSNSDAQVGTFKFCFKIVNKMSDGQLKAAFRASMALQESSGCTMTYKEIQIHGPIQFSKDIERIYVSRQQVKNNVFLDMVYEFSKKFNVEHDFI